MRRKRRTNPARYDPAQAVQKEFEEREEPDDEPPDEADDELQQSLRDLNEDAKAHAREDPPPQVVQAYANVYGAWPDGWPPR